MPIYGLSPDGSTFTYNAYDYSGTLLAGVFTPGTPVIPVTPGLRSHRVAVFENEAGTGSFTDASALAQGKAYDLIMVQLNGTESTYKSQYTAAQITSMKAANANLKMLVYRNGGEAVPIDPTGTFPEAYFAHDASGARLYNSTWHTYPMQPDSGWGTWMIAEGTNRMSVVDAGGNAVNYDGQFVDTLGDNAKSLGACLPGTSTGYTSPQWYAMTSTLAAQIKAAHSGKLIAVNGLATGTKYFQASRALLTISGAPDLALAESFVRGSGDAADAHTGTAWLNDLKMIQDANSASVARSVVCMTKDWTGALEPLKQARLQYGFGSFMLVDNGTNYFAASAAKGAGTMAIQPWLSGVDYGAPQGAYTIDGNGVYHRDFANASIAVNPTGSTFTATVRGTSQTVAPNRAVFVVDGS